MLTLPTHRTVSGIRTLSVGEGPPVAFERGDGLTSVRDKFNDNFGYLDDFVDEMQADVEDISAAVFGMSVIEGLTPTIGAGLTIDHAEGTALVGFVLTLDAGSITVLPNCNPGYVYLKQDGTWEVNDTGVAPAMTAFEFCRFVSDAGAVTSISEGSRDPAYILPARLRKVAGTQAATVEIDTPTVVTITHAYSLQVPGFKFVESSDPLVTVEPTNSDQDTPTSFQVLCTYVGDYYIEGGEGYEFYDVGGGTYSGMTIAIDIAYLRTGLGYEP